MDFIFTLILIFVCKILQVQCERHHLQFVYTVLTKPDGFFGPVFSAVGLYDDRQISHYSNEEQTWKKNSLDAEIWRYTEEPRDPRDWFINLVNTLANCTSSTCDGLHTLQRRVGCEVDKWPNGSVMNMNAFDEYGYDGDKFIAFNFDTMQWIEKSPKAKATKIKWNDQQARRQVLKMDLQKCINWISTFNNAIRDPPALHMFASAAPHDQSKLILSCLATGFYPKHMQMNITLNNITLQPFSSTGVRPNDNQTFQIRTSVEINREEKQKYECHVLQGGQTITTKWDGNLESLRHHFTAGLAAGAFVVVPVLLYLFYRKWWLNAQMNLNGSTRSENVSSGSPNLLNASDKCEIHEL